MGKIKDEWHDQFFGQYEKNKAKYEGIEYSKPRWHTDERDGSTRGKIAFRPWDEADLSDIADGWVDSDDDYDTPIPKVGSELAFNIYGIQDELLDVLLKKHEDYGPKNISQTPGGPLNGLNVRMYDKIARLDNLLKSGNAPRNESIRDTFIDLANYAIIGLLVLDGNWEK